MPSECTTADSGHAARILPASTPSSTPTAAVPAAPASSWRSLLELTVLGAIWGGSFLFMRVAAGDFGPASRWSKCDWRSAALILLPFLWQARAQFTPRLWLLIAGIATINSVVPFALFAWAAERAPAGIGAISNAMTVMFTALVAFIFYGERISARRTLGLAAGFAGVLILASGRVAGASVWPAALAGTVAALLYGVGINLVRRHLTSYPPVAVAARRADLRGASARPHWRSTPGHGTRLQRPPGEVRRCWACCAPASRSSSITG